MSHEHKPAYTNCGDAQVCECGAIRNLLAADGDVLMFTGWGDAPMVPGKIEDRYLGDGVYASFDGYHVVLDLRGQDTTTRICLEPTVFGALKEYVEVIESVLKSHSEQKAGDR